MSNGVARRARGVHRVHGVARRTPGCNGGHPGCTACTAWREGIGVHRVHTGRV